LLINRQGYLSPTQADSCKNVIRRDSHAVIRMHRPQEASPERPVGCRQSELCRHEALLNVDAFGPPDSLPVSGSRRPAGRPKLYFGCRAALASSHFLKHASVCGEGSEPGAESAPHLELHACRSCAATDLCENADVGIRALATPSDVATAKSLAFIMGNLRLKKAPERQREVSSLAYQGSNTAA
jgi:hypothetical protein